MVAASGRSPGTRPCLLYFAIWSWRMPSDTKNRSLPVPPSPPGRSVANAPTSGKTAAASSARASATINRVWKRPPRLRAATSVLIQFPPRRLVLGRQPYGHDTGCGKRVSSPQHGRRHRTSQHRHWRRPRRDRRLGARGRGRRVLVARDDRPDRVRQLRVPDRARRGGRCDRADPARDRHPDRAAAQQHGAAREADGDDRPPLRRAARARPRARRARRTTTSGAASTSIAAGACSIASSPSSRSTGAARPTSARRRCGPGC